MTKPKSEAETGIGPHWKVRVVVGCALLHIISRSQPTVRVNGHGAGAVIGIDMDVIEGTEHGDAIGYIDLSAVTSVTWRPA